MSNESTERGTSAIKPNEDNINVTNVLGALQEMDGKDSQKAKLLAKKFGTRLKPTKKESESEK